MSRFARQKVTPGLTERPGEGIYAPLGVRPDPDRSLLRISGSYVPSKGCPGGELTLGDLHPQDPTEASFDFERSRKVERRIMASSHKRWVGAAALVMTLPAGWAAYRTLRPTHTNRTDFHGARLGMSASSVRSAFPRPLSVDLSGELALTWSAASSSASSSVASEPLVDDALGTVTDVRFEFHLGLLVAVRATGESASTETQFSLTDAAFRRVADDSQGRATLLWIARDCPTHAEEVRRLTEN